MPNISSANTIAFTEEPSKHPRASGRRVSTIDEARTFEIEELFFSTTDQNGLIKTANNVFYRVSGFSPRELINTPHSIIRHPDMPRVVFQMFWDEIMAGRQILAYVKNRAKDGRYYWVVALAMPIDGGYLSVRFKPSSELFPVVQKLYRELLQVESSVENKGDGKPAAIAAGRKALDSKLHSLGFADYQAFMCEAFEREIRSRAAVLRKRRPTNALDVQKYKGKRVTNTSPGGTGLGLAESCQSALSAIDRLFNRLEIYSLSDQIRSESESVTTLSDSVQMLSMNGMIETEQLGEKGTGLGKVMDWLQGFSRDITLGCGDLTEQFARLISEVKSVVFELSSAKLQIEMTTDFALEEDRRLKEDDKDTDVKAGVLTGAMQALRVSSGETVARALAALEAVEGKLHTLESVQESLRRSIRALRLIYFKGKMELARVESEGLRIIFDNMNRYLTNTEKNLSSLEQLIGELEKELLIGLELSGPIKLAMDRIDIATPAGPSSHS